MSSSLGNLFFAAPAGGHRTGTTLAAALAALPRVPWEGGPDYWSQFPAAVAGGWDQSSFFPVAVWFNGASTTEEVAYDASVGINTYMGNCPTDPTWLADHGMYWIGGPVDGLAEDSPQWVGNYLDDEVDGRFTPTDGRAHLQALVDSFAGNGKFNYANYTSLIVQSAFADSDAEAYVNDYADVVSIDMYWHTIPHCDNTPYNPDYFIETVPQSTCRTPASYGEIMRMLRTRDAVGGQLQPLWQFIEDLSGSPIEGPYIIATPAQVKGAAMSSIINEARGLVWFNTSFGGDCPAQPVIRRAQVDGVFFCGYDQVQAMAEINNLCHAMAPILNTQSYEHTFHAGLDTMLKLGPDGSAYIFTMLGAGSSPGTFTLTLPPGITPASVDVLNESRSVSVSAGAFDDTFDADSTWHIYKVSP